MREVIANLENVINEERARVDQGEKDVRELLVENEQERRGKHELQNEYNLLVDALKHKDNEHSDMGLRVRQFSKENNELKNQIRLFEEENARMTTEYNIKLKELQGRYNREVRSLEADKYSLKQQIDNLKNELYEQTTDLREGYEMKYRKYEQELHNLSVINAELTSEITRQASVIQSSYAKYSEGLRALEYRRIKEEFNTTQREKNVDLAQPRDIEDQRRVSHQKYLNLLGELEDYKRKSLEEKQKAREEIEQLRSQIAILKEDLSKANIKIIKLGDENAAKDGFILKLEEDAEILKREPGNIAASFNEKLERLKRDFFYEKRDYEGDERRLKARLVESETSLKKAEIQIKKLKQAYEGVADMLRGNVSKIITDTFLENLRDDLYF